MAQDIQVFEEFSERKNFAIVLEIHEDNLEGLLKLPLHMLRKEEGEQRKLYSEGSEAHKGC